MKQRMARLLTLAAALFLLLLSAEAAPEARAQDGERVGLVVKFGDGTVFTDCIDYTGAGMTGEDVLDVSGLPIVKDPSYGLGAAVCKIRSNGCNYPSQHCFCKCTGSGPCLYWAYYHLDQQESAWVYSGMGASWHTVEPGDVEGWAWGDGEFGGAEVEPPLMTFEDICPPASPPTVELSADPANIAAGQCSTLRWSVDSAIAVTLDGEGVRPSDTRYVCPMETHLYELQVLSAAGEYSYEVTIRVTPASPTPRATATPTRLPTATAQLSSAPPPAATRVPQAPALSASPSPTSTETSTTTATPTFVAMIASDTPSVEPLQVAIATQSPPTSAPEAESVPTEAPPEESVGLDRLLLLLGVGAGSIGFGAIAFVGMLVLLFVIYLRGRTQF